MADRFRSYQELARAKKEGRHFAIRYKPGKTGVLILAPHGGKIEPGTSELAQLIAGADHAFYAFEGAQLSCNFKDLHLTSTCFNEPLALQKVITAEYVLTIHGQGNADESFILVGGLDRDLAERITHELLNRGFHVAPERPGLAGCNPANICNRNQRGRGVQLEISKQLRQRLQWDLWNQKKFVEAVRTALREIAPPS